MTDKQLTLDAINLCLANFRTGGKLSIEEIRGTLLMAREVIEETITLAEKLDGQLKQETKESTK
jgi:hypothetical protein